MPLPDEFYLRNKRNDIGADIPGLVRMDRALIYIKQQLARIIKEVKNRNTKGIGDTQYTIRSFYREVFNLCRMSGDLLLAEQISTSLRDLHSRTPCDTAILLLTELKDKIDSYEPVKDLDDIQSLRERIVTLEQQLSDEESDDETNKFDTSSEKSVFVIMPFNSEFQDVWKGGIEMAAKTKGLTPIRVDMINKSSNITDDIVESINKCKLAIVDVTNNNPNVMFELGYALAKNKTNIIISQSADDLPFDIRNIRTIVYTNTWSGIEELRGKIQDFLHEYLPKKSGSKKPLTRRVTVKKKATKK